MIDRAPGFGGLIGVAGLDITPPVGIRMTNWGAQRHEVSTGNDGQLFGSVWTFRAAPGEPPLILAGLDLGWWRDPADEWFLREPLVELAGDEARVVVGLSHTHSGPSITRSDGGLVPEYLRMVRDRLREAAERALAAEKERTVTWQLGRHPFGADRDLPLGDGRYAVGYHPGAPVDDVAVIGSLFEGHVERGSLMGVALHPTMVGPENTLVSGDYVASLRKEVPFENEGFLFLQGASGEIAPRDNYASDFGSADWLGQGLAAWRDAMTYASPGTRRLAGIVDSGAPLAVWESFRYDSQPEAPPSTLSAKKIAVTLPLKPLPDEDEGDPAARERMARRRRVRAWVGSGESFDLPVWVWEIGDLSLVAVPGEAYSVLRTELQARFPNRIVLPVNVANGWTGYLPPESLYDNRMYSVEQTPFAAGGLERLIAACAAEMENPGEIENHG